MAVGSDLLPLISACAELSSLTNADSDGVLWLPYWSAMLVGLGLVGPDLNSSEARAAFDVELWRWILDPEPIGRAVLAVVDGGCFEVRPYTLAGLVAALRVARDTMLDPGAAAAGEPDRAPFLISHESLLRTGRARTRESLSEADTRAEADDDEPNAVRPPLAMGALYSHFVGRDGTFRLLAYVEVLLFPRFVMSERTSRGNGWQALVDLGSRLAFADFVEEEGESPNIDWMGETEAMRMLLQAIEERLPPVQICGAPDSPSQARMLLARWLREPAVTDPGLTSRMSPEAMR